MSAAFMTIETGLWDMKRGYFFGEIVDHEIEGVAGKFVCVVNCSGVIPGNENFWMKVEENCAS